MKYATIQLDAELVSRPGHLALMVSYNLQINGQLFQPNVWLDLTALVKSCQWSGPLDIFTCSCGEPGCAGIFQEIEVNHAHDAITWKCPNPLTVSEEMPDLWDHGVTTFDHYSFEPEQYIGAVDAGIKKIQSLSISSLRPVDFPVHGVELEQVMALETRPFSTHTMEPERRILARQVVVDAYHVFVAVGGVGYQMEDLNLSPELMQVYLTWKSICVFPNSASEIPAYLAHLQSGRSFCRELRKFIGRRTAVSFKYRPPDFYNREAWEIIEVIR